MGIKMYNKIKRSDFNKNCEFNIKPKLSHAILFFILANIFGSWQNQLTAQPLAEGMDKFLGAGTNSNIYRYFDDYWNQITPGNDGKWGSVEAVRGTFNWSNLDKIYTYAINRDLLFKEHALVWGNQQPSWIASLDSAGQRQEVEEWIKAIGKRYPDMAFVDVVNEPFNGPPSYKNALGGDGETGWDWVITAFELARQYCPEDAKLILNEYNILHSTSQTTEYIKIIDLLKDRDLIDGIGIQGHYFEFRSDLNSSNTYVWSVATIKNNLDKLAETGIPVYLTEFDIDEPDDANQLEQYKIYFPIFWNHPGVHGITFWGYIQGDVWNSHPNTYLLLANGTERPALQWMREFILYPAPPVLISPENFAPDQPRNPVLIWKKSESADSYHVQVSKSIAFTSLIVDTTVTDTTLRLKPLDAGSRYYWRVSATNDIGESNFSDALGFVAGDQIVSVEELRDLPYEYNLYQNYPNPFNPETTISFNLPEDSYVRLILLDVLGKVVKVIASDKFSAGRNSITFDASGLVSGVYFYRMETSLYNNNKKLILLK
jgi:endo-1,4-beta-xylanase